MGKSEDKQKKEKKPSSVEKSSSKKPTIPSDQKQVVQAVLNYLSSLGLNDVCKALESASDLQSVRTSTQFHYFFTSEPP